jgi:DNA-binding CsgD family transcriptional regulator/tetratricopeptide (TPR) repeat protein
VVAVLYGRAVEQSVIEQLLADANGGRSGVLVIRGDPGIGKTALLDYAARSAKVAPGPDGVGMRVIRVRGVESEAELPFAGLHLLLRSALDHLPALPQTQQDALGAALGLRRAGPHDRFLVGVAVLSLLAELAEGRPLLCLVDDAHWLDRASASALVFAARRLDAEGIAIIFAARDNHAVFPASGLRVLRLSGLDAASAAALLADHAGELAPFTRSRILAEARGNPLGLIELGAAYLASPPALPTAGWPGNTTLALTDRLQQAFEGQIRRLPADTRTILLAAASEDSGDLGVLLDAAAALGVEAAALGRAEQAGLIGIADRTVTFRHPLVRAALYQGATLSQRLAVHRALAAALRSPADADRRAWHLAAAATGPDEKVAAELERTAGEARARSGYAAAVAAYERAVQLGTDLEARPGRLAAAAEASVETGDLGHARGLAARAATQTTDPVVRARLANVRARADVAQGQLHAAHRLLVEGAGQIASLDAPQATRMLAYAMHVAWYAGDRGLVADTAGRLTAVGGSLGEPFTSYVQLLLRLAVQAAERPGEDLPPLADLVARAGRARAGSPYDLTMIAIAALVTGRIPDACDLLGTLVTDARALGRIGWLPSLLMCLAQAQLLDGRHSDALASATEALRIARDTGQPQWTSDLNAIMAYLASAEGDQDRCRQLADAALAEPASASITAARAWVQWALGLLDLGRGRPDTALVQLETIWPGPARFHASTLRSVPDLVEAAVRVGQPERAAEPLARFSDWARRAYVPALEALAERCRALLEAGEEAEQHYLTALKLHDGPFEQARTQLLYGAWLRRARRKSDARTQLRAAIDTLDRIHAASWAEQARAELAAAGATAPRTDRASAPRLTPQEMQVARLAAQGLSNRDIAAQLFLSPRTVGYHLYKAFPKLGITSRSQLDPGALRP